jgi:hypothetical protein
LNKLALRWRLGLALLALAARAPMLWWRPLPPSSPLPWGPLLYWLPAGLAAGLGPPAPWLGVLSAFADAGSAVLLALLVQRHRLADSLLADNRGPQGWKSPGVLAGLAWALHPAALLCAGAGAAWQSGALLGVLYAAWQLEYGAAGDSERRAALALGAAGALAWWPLLLLPFCLNGFLSARERGRFIFFALLPALLLALPTFLLKDWAAIRPAVVGPSPLGVPGLWRSLAALAGAPENWLESALHAWRWAGAGLLALFLLWASGRRLELFQGLALGSLTWLLLAPQLQPELLLGPLGLWLLLPGRAAWRWAGASTLLLLAAAALPQGAGAAALLWSALLLAWLFVSALEWARLKSSTGFRA